MQNASSLLQQTNQQTSILFNDESSFASLSRPICLDNDAAHVKRAVEAAFQHLPSQLRGAEIRGTRGYLGICGGYKEIILRTHRQFAGPENASGCGAK